MTCYSCFDKLSMRVQGICLILSLSKDEARVTCIGTIAAT